MEAIARVAGGKEAGGALGVAAGCVEVNACVKAPFIGCRIANPRVDFLSCGLGLLVVAVEALEGEYGASVDREAPGLCTGYQVLVLLDDSLGGLPGIEDVVNPVEDDEAGGSRLCKDIALEALQSAPGHRCHAYALIEDGDVGSGGVLF